MNSQPTRHADNGSPTVESHMEQDNGNPTVSCSIAMATQFTASEHLNDPGHLSEECLSFIALNGTGNLSWRN